MAHDTQSPDGGRGPLLRRVLGGALAVVIAIAGVVGLIAFFNGRDSSTTGGEGTTPSPGVSAPAGRSALLKSGNVVLTYSDRSFTPALRKLAAGVGAPDTPELRAAGQAVVLRVDPKVGGVAARALSHSLVVRTPSDPALQDFIERWLGPGS